MNTRIKALASLLSITLLPACFSLLPAASTQAYSTTSSRTSLHPMQMPYSSVASVSANALASACNDWVERDKQTASDGAANDAFGISVSISGDTMVVGALFGDSGRGAAYVFERNQGGAYHWGEVKKLTASDGEVADLFGGVISISGNTIVVGAPGDDSLKGSAYVFERNQGGANNWGEVKKLTASDGAMPDLFGTSVSISSDTIVVGARGNDSDRGSAYVYERNQGGANNWGEVKKLTASDGVAGDQFGESVSIRGNTIVVGAWLDDSQKGAAYVFTRNQGGTDNWGEVRKLIASDRADGDLFGNSVSNIGDTIVVGAPGDDSLKGSAYVYERNQGGTDNWGEVKKLTASDGGAGDQFGGSVSISGDTIVVGADADDSSKGSAYAFERDQGGAENWGEVKKLTASDGGPFNHFGFSLSISGDTFVVGAYLHDSNKGSSHVFTINCPPVMTTNPVSLNRDSTLMGAQIATVSDDITPAANLAVTVVSSPAGITVSNITNNNGTITASVAVSCTAPLGANTVTLSVLDEHGLVTMADLTVNVSAETIPPVITCPANITQSASVGQCSAVVTYATPAVTDNCPGVGVPVCSPTSGSIFPKGTTAVTCSVRDTAGNQGSCSFSVTVVDTQPPSISNSPNIVTNTINAGDASIAVTFPTPAASDNCSGVAVVCSPPSGSAFPRGVTTVTCTATDAGGNHSSCSFTVRVFDYVIKDDTNGQLLRFDSGTGEYDFFDCRKNLSLHGVGVVTINSCKTTMTDTGPDPKRPDRNLLVQANWCTRTGSATLTYQGATRTLNDPNLSNNIIGCP